MAYFSLLMVLGISLTSGAILVERGAPAKARGLVIVRFGGLVLLFVGALGQITVVVMNRLAN